MEYHVQGRLVDAPQVRIQTQSHTPGFPSQQSAIDWAKKVLFNWEVYCYNGNKRLVVASQD